MCVISLKSEDLWKWRSDVSVHFIWEVEMSGGYPAQQFQEKTHPLDLRFTVGCMRQHAAWSI